MASEKRYTVELTEKEMYLLWRLLAWFYKKPFTQSLRNKLGKGFDLKRRMHLDALYEEAIDDQLAKQGQWLTDYRKDQEARNGE